MGSAQLWLWVLLVAQCLALGLSLYWLRARRAAHWFRPLLLVLVTLPLIAASVAWLDLGLPAFVRLERRWLAWLPGTAALWVWWRLWRTSSPVESPQLWLRDTLLCCAAMLAGATVSGIQLVEPLDRLAIIVAVDRSRSTELVPNVQERLDRELTAARTSMSPTDRLGIVAFGANAVVRLPPLERASSATPSLAPVVRDGTDLERALRRALAELPADATGKIVLLSDGVATRGDASDAVAAAVAAEIPIDVVVLDQAPLSNVRIVKLNAPASVSEGEIFELRLVVESPAALDLQLRQLEDGRQLRETEVSVGPGKTLLSLRHTAQLPGLHRLEVQVATNQPALDQLAEDNRMATFVRVRGQTRALVISRTGESLLDSVLSAGNIDTRVSGPDEAPTTLPELSTFDLIVLEDVSAGTLPSSLPDALSTYVRAGGGGLLLMGAPNTLGPGGYARTPIEELSPVSFDLKQDRRRGQLSEVIAVDYSGSMGAPAGTHSKLDLANEGAVRSLALLGPGDRLGVLHVDTEPTWTLDLGPLNDKRASAERIIEVGPGGGGILLDPALTTAYAALRSETSALKHVLLFADGSDAQGSPTTLNHASAARAAGITTSVVALGQGGDLPLLEHISQQGGGRFYLLSDAARIPAVFAQETITAARAAVREEPFVATKHAGSAVVRGIDFPKSPLLGGYVVTLRKPRALVPLRAKDDDPLLATWSAGLGQCAVFTSDYGGRWGAGWTKWASGAQLFVQLARSLARNEDDSSVRLDAAIRDGRLELSVDALSAQGSLDNLRDLAAAIAHPNGDLQRVALRPSGSGRYAATMPVQRPGTYLVSIVDAQSDTLLATTGLEMSTGDELEPTGTDRPTLAAIAERSGGRVRENLAGLFRDRSAQRRGYSSRNVSLIWWCALCLLASVITRKVQFGKLRAAIPNGRAVQDPKTYSPGDSHAPGRSDAAGGSRAPALHPHHPPSSRPAPRPANEPHPDAGEPKEVTAATLSTAQLLLQRRLQRRRQQRDREDG